MSPSEEPGPPRVSYLTARLDRLLRVALADALSPHEISLPEYTALSILGRRAGLTNAQLARRTYVSPQAMHQITDGLAARDLITLAPGEAGGRLLPATLTPRGREVLAACDASVDVVEERMMDGMQPWARGAFHQFLLDCIAGLGGRASGRDH
jgi:DNA-binding MarR family transcriptional regulator